MQHLRMKDMVITSYAKRFLTVVASALIAIAGMAQKVDYSVVAVPEEAECDFVCITSDADQVCLPQVKRGRGRVNWFSNRILDIDPQTNSLAYLSARNKTTNIFIKALDKQGGSIQRTNRSAVIDFSYSPDGRYICFSEKRGKTNQIFRTDAQKGYVCRQITSGALDYSPIYSADMSQIFFTRQEARNVSIWSYNMEDNFLSTYSNGLNPYPLKAGQAYICARANATGQSELWKISYDTGTEECIISDPQRSFTSPIVSPDGQWVLFVGSSRIISGNIDYSNTDLFVARLDGSEMTQLTYHAADDLSPIWSLDGKYIYFISQRGSATGTANVWRMTFNY